MFGKSKEDKGQDKQIKDIWKWMEGLNKNHNKTDMCNKAYVTALNQINIDGLWGARKKLLSLFSNQNGF